MRHDVDREIYLQRAAQERACAAAATSEQVRTLHRELAALFEDRAADLELVTA